MDLSNVRFSDSAPYPAIEVCEKNPQYAAAMLSNLGSCKSEMSTISLYFYNNLITKELFPDIALCFHKISIVEMRHLSMLGELALKLGTDPRLWSPQKGVMRYWSPDCCLYPTRIGAILANSLAGEQEAIHTYQKQVKWIKDCHIAAVLNRIIADEQCHVKIFEQLLSEIDTSPCPVPVNSPAVQVQAARSQSQEAYVPAGEKTDVQSQPCQTSCPQSQGIQTKAGLTSCPQSQENQAQNGQTARNHPQDFRSQPCQASSPQCQGTQAQPVRNQAAQNQASQGQCVRNQNTQGQYARNQNVQNQTAQVQYAWNQMAQALSFRNQGSQGKSARNSETQAVRSQSVEAEPGKVQPVPVQSVVESHPLQAQPVVKSHSLQSQSVVTAKPVQAQPVVTAKPAQAQPVVTAKPVQVLPVVKSQPLQAQSVSHQPGQPQYADAGIRNASEGNVRKTNISSAPCHRISDNTKDYWNSDSHQDI